MYGNEQHELVLENLIERIDPNRVITNDFGHLVVFHPGEPGYDEARPRKPNELSLAKLTRKLFLDEDTKELRTELDLSEEEREALLYFTYKRKEAGAFKTAIIMADLMDSHRFQKDGRKPLSEFWQSNYIENEAQFLDVLVNEVFRRGNRVFDPSRRIDFKDKKYVAIDVLKEFVRGLKNQGTKSVNHRVQKLMKEASKTPYHMMFHSRDNMPSNRNHLAVIYGRVKESNSENKKQSAYWARDIKQMEEIATLRDLGVDLSLEEVPGDIKQEYRRALKAAERYRDMKPEYYIYKLDNRTRFDELMDRWYYGIEDSYGITIVYSHRVGPEEIEETREYFHDLVLCDIVPGSFDDHTKQPNKPQEVQFKIKLNRYWVEEALPPHLFHDFYVPDNIEIQVTSLPDLVHKYLTPGLAETDYKKRFITEKLGISESNPDFLTIFQTLQGISPVQGTMEYFREHRNQLRKNLSYIGRESRHELQEDYEAVILDLLTAGTFDIN